MRGRSRKQCGRANRRTSAEENFFHANANPTPEKENDNLNYDQKEIADANTVPEFVPNGIAEKEEGFAFTGGNARPFADCFSQKETHSGSGRRDAYADSEEEKDFADAFTDCVAASKKENVAVATTI